MKTLIALFMAGVSCVSMATERVADHQQQPAVEQYRYGTQLDVAKVISRSGETSEVCGIVPVQMTYEDHQGQRHTVEYQVMGTGCLRG